jgi:hypothetical protein
LVRPGPRMGEAALILSQCVAEKVSSTKWCLIVKSR